MEPGKLSLLIVEDELELAEIVARKLTGTGEFSVLTCAKISEANTKLANQKFDCVLLDLRLEGGSGERVVSFVRSHKNQFNYKTPILVMSAFLDPQVIVRIGRDVQGMLVKPFDMDGLVEKVRALCEGQDLRFPGGQMLPSTTEPEVG